MTKTVGGHHAWDIGEKYESRGMKPRGARVTAIWSAFTL